MLPRQHTILPPTSTFQLTTRLAVSHSLRTQQHELKAHNATHIEHRTATYAWTEPRPSDILFTEIPGCGGLAGRSSAAGDDSHDGLLWSSSRPERV